MRTSSVTSRINITGKKTVQVDALFDTGAVRSVMSKQLADRIGTYSPLAVEVQHETVRVTGVATVQLEIAGCKLPSIPFEVSPDLREDLFIIGRPELDTFDIVFDKKGRPRSETCPAALGIY